jgi:DNA-binding XRE family transcriptional regulator
MREHKLDLESAIGNSNPNERIVEQYLLKKAVDQSIYHPSCAASESWKNWLILMNETDISALLREFRRRLGLTQEQLAAKLGVTFVTINRWENGRTKPSPLAWKQIETLLRESGALGNALVETYLQTKD